MLTVPVAGSQVTSSVNPYSGYCFIIVAAQSRFVRDTGVTYLDSGAALTNIGSGVPGHAGQYGVATGAAIGVAPAGSTFYLFNIGDQDAGITISFEYSVAASFVPDVTPIYDLDDNDFKYDPNEDPIKVTRSDPYEAYNVWRLEIAERVNAYNLTTIEARDQNAIELYGERIASTVTAHELCDPNVGLISVQLMLQRAVYIRNTYKFRGSWGLCLLDPMDIVTVYDPVLGLSNTPVRITEIEEDENGFLEFTAEEFPEGVATAVLYATQTNSGTTINRATPAGSVNPPFIFEPPLALGGGFAVWAGVSGTGSYWGGANVYASFDGSTYSQIGTVNAAAKMGVTLADLPSVTPSPSGLTIDQTHTLAVNLSESEGVLNNSTQQAALALANSCYLGSGEVISYANSTLTAANEYDLSYLIRGAYGSTIADVPQNSNFVFLDESLFEYTFSANAIGTTLYLKFQSFNTWGGGMQSLADCTAYSYAITGSALGAPLLSTVANFQCSAIQLNGVNGTTGPGIALTWTPVIDKTVTAVIVSYSIAGVSGTTQRQDFPPAGGLGVISAGLQPATLYDVSATITTNPLRAVTSTPTRTVTTGSQTVANTNTVSPGGVTLDAFDTELQDTIGLVGPTQLLATNTNILAEATASTVSSLQNTVASNYTSITAAITNEAAIRTSANSAFAAQLTTLNSTLTTDISSVNASITSLSTTVATNNSATASQITNLTTTVNGNTSTLQVVEEIKSTACRRSTASRSNTTTSSAVSNSPAFSNSTARPALLF